MKKEEESIKLENVDTKEQIVEYENRMAAASAEIQSVSNSRNELKKEALSKEEGIQQEKESFQSRLNKLESIEQQLTQLESIDIISKLESVSVIMKEGQSKYENIKLEAKTISDQIEEIKTKRSSKDLNKRNLADNIRYRQQLSQIRQMENKIKEKEEYLTSVSGSLDQLDLDLAPLEKEQQNIKSKYDRLLGARATLQEQVKHFEKDLNKPTYKTIDEDYRKMLIELKVS